MSGARFLGFLLCSWIGLGGCSALQPAPDPDVIDVTLPAGAEAVKLALTDVLADEGYDVEQQDTDMLVTGTRKEIRGPWDWLLRWRFGVGKSRVEATVTALETDSSRMRLQVFHRSKDGIFDAWQEAETPLPQSAINQVRLVKNRLHLL
jgi:hypothetical protein